jgi:hypothetical protein
MATKAERLVFIDVLRLIAAVQMIQGHAVAAVLAPEYRAGPLFAAWSFARGLTSVMFLFAAGYSFALAAERGGGRARVRRALMLVALGYLMHAPFALALGAEREATLRSAVVVDVLQCIGVSLLSLEWFASRVRQRQIALLIALGLFQLAPLTASIPATGPLTNYLTSRGGSLFPLIPWSGYVFAGFALASWRSDVARTLSLASLSAFALGALSLWRERFEAGHCLVKLACVLALAGTLAWWLRGRSLPPLLSRLSRETLFLYLSHVVILYADQVGLASRWGGQRSPWFGLGLALVLLVGCSAAALAWRSLRAPLASGTRAPQS